MVEIELKFQIEPARRDAVRRAVVASGASAQKLRLQARYFDTPDACLAGAGLALRLRREGRSRWVQTLKGRGDGLMQRLEHEVVLPPGVPATLDLSRHDGTPAAAALRSALGPRASELVERFATDIQRTRRVVRALDAEGLPAAIELAWDEGWITALRDEKPQRVAVAELEFELLSGPPQALLGLASRWVGRHGLWLDVRSKAERGHALAAGRPAAATQAQAALVSRRMAPARALAAVVQAALAQVLPNLAALADAGPLPAEHVHQLRVGLRRLRVALREFGAGAAGVDPGWDGVLAQLFRALGQLRDRDVAQQVLRPAREAAARAGLEFSPPPARHAVAPALELAAALRERGLHQLLLALIGLTLPSESAPGAAPGAAPLLDVARKRLTRLHKKVRVDAMRFADLDDAARHRLRKRLKRLRYSLDFVAPLFAAKSVAAYLALLKPAQEALGQCNDLALTEAAGMAAGARSPGDAYVLGWLGARRDVLSGTAAKRLKALSTAARCWKH